MNEDDCGCFFVVRLVAICCCIYIAHAHRSLLANLCAGISNCMVFVYFYYEPGLRMEGNKFFLQQTRFSM